MRFITPFTPPTENEFLQRGFFPAEDHDPDDGVLSFGRDYPDGSTLRIKLEMGISSRVSVRIGDAKHPGSSVRVEGVECWSFQSWHSERVMRYQRTSPTGSWDLRIHYDPVPVFHICAQGG